MKQNHVSVNLTSPSLALEEAGREDIIGAQARVKTTRDRNA
jgi:hypothetical protein